jgi:hypothetical protein
MLIVLLGAGALVDCHAPKFDGAMKLAAPSAAVAAVAAVAAAAVVAMKSRRD